VRDTAVEASFEGLVPITLDYVLKRQFVERWHLFEDEGVISRLVLVEVPVMRTWLGER
jgi:hypothetical protein